MTVPAAAVDGTGYVDLCMGATQQKCLENADMCTGTPERKHVCLCMLKPG
jgi:hypothetical protein